MPAEWSGWTSSCTSEITGRSAGTGGPAIETRLRRSQTRCGSCAEGWNAELATIEGARIEDKGTILSVHYRNAPEPDAARERIIEALDRIVASDRYALSEGKMVVEVRPKLPLDKGSVVKSLVGEHGLKSIVFLGDDRTDVDAMAALRELRPGLSSLAIGVGGDEAPAELAETS